MTHGRALLDSEADEVFLDAEFAAQASSPVDTLEKPLEAFALNEHRLVSVTQCTSPVSLTIAGKHGETVLHNSISVSLCYSWLPLMHTT